VQWAIAVIELSLSAVEPIDRHLQKGTGTGTTGAGWFALYRTHSVRTEMRRSLSSRREWTLDNVGLSVSATSFKHVCSTTAQVSSQLFHRLVLTVWHTHGRCYKAPSEAYSRTGLAGFRRPDTAELTENLSDLIWSDWLIFIKVHVTNVHAQTVITTWQNNIEKKRS